MIDSKYMAFNVLRPDQVEAQQQQLIEGRNKLSMFPLEKRAAEQKVQQGDQEIQNGDLKNVAAKLDFSVGELGKVYDQNSYNQFREKMHANGIDTQGDPDAYDPNWQKQTLMGAMSMKDKLHLQLEQQKFNEQSRHNRVGEGIMGRYGKAPSGYSYGEDGELSFIPGGLADPANKPMNEYQGKAALFSARMNDAEPIIGELGKSVGVSLGDRAAEKIPLVGNYLVSSDYQKLDQAERNFVNATLRQESGAAINQSEFDNAVKQYFPRPGDGEDVIAQKEQNRATAIKQMGQAAGPAYQKQSGNNAPTSAAAHPKLGNIEDGYKFLGGDPSDKNNWKKVR